MRRALQGWLLYAPALHKNKEFLLDTFNECIRSAEKVRLSQNRPEYRRSGSESDSLPKNQNRIQDDSSESETDFAIGDPNYDPAVSTQTTRDSVGIFSRPFRGPAAHAAYIQSLIETRRREESHDVHQIGNLRYSFEKTTVNDSPSELKLDAVTVTLEPVYPKDVMRALDKHVEEIARVLQPVQDVCCLSGFDRITPELKFIDDDDKDFFTGNSSLTSETH